MKKGLFYSLMAASTLVGFASCSSDEPANAPSGDGNVTFSLELPAGLGTRAFSDGLSAQELSYYVYDEDKSEGSTNIAALNGNAEFPTGSRSTTVSLNLVTGKSYSIVFFAKAKGQTAYSYDATTKDLSVSYEDAVAQDESRDAFYAYEAKFKVEGAISKRIELKRPFAQINIGTTDWEVAKAANSGDDPVTATGVTVKGVANKINLGDGAVDGNETVTFALTDLPGNDETFPYEEAGVDRYLSMNYILVGADKSTVDVTLSCTADPAKPAMDFTQVPVQRNYRTNIYGALLTNPAIYNVVIDQNYETPSHQYEYWDGTVSDPVQDKTDANLYTIGNAAQFAGFAAKVNGGEKYEGKTVKLSADINLGGRNWTPIGFSTSFNGTFDGQDHVISGLVVNNKTAATTSHGLFGWVSGTVKNVKVQGASIIADGKRVGATSAGVIVGRLYPDGFNSPCLIENCEVSDAVIDCPGFGGGIVGHAYGSANNNIVKNCRINATKAPEADGDNDKVGGIVGYLAEIGGSSIYSANNNTVEGCTLFGSRNIGGIVGCAQSGSHVKNNTVKDTEVLWSHISGDASSNSGSYSNGAVIGRNISAVAENNTTENVTVKKQ